MHNDHNSTVNPTLNSSVVLPKKTTKMYCSMSCNQAKNVKKTSYNSPLHHLSTSGIIRQQVQYAQHWLAHHSWNKLTISVDCPDCHIMYTTGWNTFSNVGYDKRTKSRYWGWTTYPIWLGEAGWICTKYSLYSQNHSSNLLNCSI